MHRNLTRPLRSVLENKIKADRSDQHGRIRQDSPVAFSGPDADSGDREEDQPVTQNVAHYSSMIKFVVQFPIKVDRTLSPLRADSPFVVGYSGITFSAGPFAGERLALREFEEFVATVIYAPTDTARACAIM